ncbi:MAG: zinc-dependent peptidase [Paucimonas sp.]|jgi:Mlc titration factor MtfA (ptsG expression regulator)|nr:zinc-dependent peptidase [Paucimonas sp.]
MKLFKAISNRFSRLLAKRPQIPDSLWFACLAQLPFLQGLSREEIFRLKKMSEAFLSKVPIRGAADFELSNQAAVLIAAQASYVVLNLTLDLYDDVPAIIVYPSGFMVARKEVDSSGIVHEWNEPLAGEAIQQGGAIVLSWEDVENSMHGYDGRNVVIHEFAHKIDMKRSIANGYPPFLTAFHQSIKPVEWQRAFSEAFEDFAERVEAQDNHYHTDWDAGGSSHVAWIGPLPLDPYGATNAAEFFAVCSESFFLRPAPLAAAYPHIYSLLSRYYRRDPLERRSYHH